MSSPRLKSFRSISAGALVTLALTTAVLGDQAAVRVSPGTVEILKAIDSLAPHVVGLFRDPIGFKQTANGDYYVFDRRGHTVFRVDRSGDVAKKLVQIGAEEGRLHPRPRDEDVFEGVPGGPGLLGEAEARDDSRPRRTGRSGAEPRPAPLTHAPTTLSA